MSSRDLADAINRQQLYVRPSDGQPVAAKQIAARVRGAPYRNQYVIDAKHRISLRGVATPRQPPGSAKRSRRTCRTGPRADLQLSTPPRAEQPIGPAAWRNWHAATTGAPWQQRVEHGLYSDSGFVGDLPNLGPYHIINTVSRTGPASAGDSQQSLVLRHDWHLPIEPLLIRADPLTTQVEAYHGGWVDEELAALLSLALGVRCRSGGVIRVWWSADDELGRPSAFDHRPPTISRARFSMLPHVARDQVLLDDCRPLLEGYATLGAANAITLVRAARQYQLAIWNADDDPNLTWLQLVGALEAAGREQTIDTPFELLDELWPELGNILHHAKLDDSHAIVQELAQLVRATKRIREIVRRYMPAPLEPRPPSYQQVKWNRLVESVTRIYALRSRALHEGVPMPGPLLQPPLPAGDPLPERPGGTHGIGDSVWTDADMPMYLHVFAHVVRDVLCGWWEDLISSAAH
jgi:hypothetical protein